MTTDSLLSVIRVGHRLNRDLMYSPAINRWSERMVMQLLSIVLKVAPSGVPNRLREVAIS